ncbi:MAG: sulfatase-like hydrolase/transferase [Chitinophagaceae bacterium]
MLRIPRLIKWIFILDLFFLLIMTLLRLGAWSFFKTGQVTFNESTPAFILGIRYDARIVGVFSLLILLFGSIPAIHPFHSAGGKKIWLFFTGLFSCILIILYVFDFLHFRYLSQRLNASALTYLEDAKISSAMVWQTYPVIRILLGIVISIFFFIWINGSFYRKIARCREITPKARRVFWFITCFLIFALATFGRIGQYPLRWSDAFSTGSDFEANIALNPFQSFLSTLSFRSSTFDKMKVQQYYPLMADYLGVDKPDPLNLNFERSNVKRDSGITTKPNIVIVICESFSAYKSSMWGNPLNTTPFFDSLCKQGIFFDKCFTPHFGTARGVWATVTGIPDVTTVKTASRNPAMVDQHSIINDFTSYEKFYFLGGSTSWANIRGLLTNNIKNLHLYEEGAYNAPKMDVWGISDKNLFLEANKVLSQQRSPFIAVIQTADNHRPYSISPEDLHEFSRVNLPTDSINKYGFESNDELNAFRYTDFGFRKFITAARQSPYFDNTIFVFVGDHGINGNAADMFPRSWTDNGLTSYHVPLLFYSPKLLSAVRLHELASQVDLLPTVAGLANINYTNTTLGRDLLQKEKKPAMAFIMDHNNNNIGVIKGNYFYTRQPSGNKEDLVWADFLQKESGIANDSIKGAYRELTSAIFETARYMLLNNNKK